jgi:hypothetical protein
MAGAEQELKKIISNENRYWNILNMAGLLKLE